MKLTVVPYLMVTLDVIIETISILIENISIEPTYEADVFHVFCNLTFLVAKLGKRIDDNTKDNVDENNVNECEERNIKDHSEDELPSVL